MKNNLFLALFTLCFPIWCAAQTPDTFSARSVLKEGRNLWKARQFKQALSRADSAAAAFRAVGGEACRGYCDALTLRAHTLEDWGRLDSAIAVWQRLIPLREKITGRIHQYMGDAYLNLGILYRKKINCAKAWEAHRQAIEIYRSLYGDIHPEVARPYQNMSECYFDAGAFDKAFSFGEQALEIHLKSGKKGGRDVVMAYNNLGAISFVLGQYKKSVAYLEESLRLYRAANTTDSLDAIVIYGNLGLSLTSMGDAETGLKMQQKALAIQQKLQRDDDPDLAETYDYISIALSASGDYDRAIEYSEKAISIWKKSPLKGLAKLGGGYLNLGNALVYKGLLDEAIAHYQTAIGYWILTTGEKNPYIASAYNNIASACERKGDYARQLEYAQKSHSIRLRTLPEGHPDIAVSYTNLGLAYYKKGELDSAAIALNTSQELLKKAVGDQHPYRVTLLNILALLHFDKGENAAGVAALQQAKAANRYTTGGAFEPVLSVPDLLVTLSELGEAWKNRPDSAHLDNHLELAEQTFAQACEAVDFLRNSPLGQGSKEALAKRAFPVFEGAISSNYLLFRETGRRSPLRRAFAASEQAKSYSLYEALQKTNALQFAGIPAALLEQERALRLDIADLEKQRFTGASADAFTDTLFRLKRRYDALLDLLRRDYADYFDLKFGKAVVSPDSVQRSLARDQCLLEYFVGDSAVYIFVVAPDTFDLVVVRRGKSFPLEEYVQTLRQGLYGYHTAHKKVGLLPDEIMLQYAEPAYLLYQKLLAPVEHLLTRKVLIVPDGLLNYIPFEALLKEKASSPPSSRFHTYRYWGNDHVVSYSYSATLQQRMTKKRHKSPASETVLALAPFYRGGLRQAASTGSILNLRSDTLGALPFSGPEAQRICGIFKGKALLGDTAGLEALARLAGAYRILHFSTHGEANDKVGDYAFLGLGVPGDTTLFSKLFIKDIYNFRLQADLVVLSACETGTGELRRGEGIISLARAFAYAGAKSIVTTLWSVGDASTAQLMEYFYTNLAAGMPKDEALWRAKQAYFSKNTGFRAHPFFWAAFIPVGDMAPVAGSK